MTRSRRRKLTALRYAFERESSARRLLSFDISTARKRTLDDEESNSHKRLKKQDDKVTWNAREVFKAKGYTDDEIETYMTALPNRDPIYMAPEA